MKNLYDESYYERGIEEGISGYTNYRWIPELTIPMAARIIEFLQIRESDKILDFGCAKGYLVRALRLLHREAWGYDISAYATENCPKEVEKYIISDYSNMSFDWIISKDVFEHIDYTEINEILRRLHDVTKKMFVIVPLGEQGKYNVPAYDMDATHRISESLDWWKKKLQENGFEILNALYSVSHLKENYAQYENGNGFFVCHSVDNIDR